LIWYKKNKIIIKYTHTHKKLKKNKIYTRVHL
jgi:hypothetical protein